MSPADATRKRVYCPLRKPGDSDLLGGRAPRTANWASFYRQKKKHIISMLHTGYKVIGYMFAKQSSCYKLCGLHVYKAILLVQLRGLLFKLRRPWAFYWVHIDWLAPGHPMGAGNPTISWKPKPKSRPPASPSPGSPT